MSSSARRRRLEVEDVGDVTVVNFVDRKILDEQNIQIIGEQLFSLVSTENRRKIVLNFGNVEYLSSAATGKFITLNKMLQTVGGLLVLCGIDPKIEVFEIQKLDKFFRIYKEEQEALQAVLDVSLSEASVLTCPIPGCPGTILDVGKLPETHWPSCPDCDAFFRWRLTVPSGGWVKACVRWATGQTDEPQRPVSEAWMKTYPGESVHLLAGTPFTIQIKGRLDLFASEVLARLWRAIPSPRRVLIDASSLTELSKPGLSALLELAGEADTKAVVLLSKHRPPEGISFPADSTFTDRDAAIAALGKIPEASRRPLIVKVRKEMGG
jgi:anti-sigma B factor antagonist